MSEDGTVIPNLYVAGEMLGGLFSWAQLPRRQRTRRWSVFRTAGREPWRKVCFEPAAPALPVRSPAHTLQGPVK